MTRKNSNKSKTVVVYLEFDAILQKITGTAKEKIVLSEGTPFIMLLDAVLETYSHITNTYAISSLGFSINGEIPEPDDMLRNDDTITLLVTENDDALINFFSSDYTH
jgi:hypothetical protein